jgi:uncharacterized membrane protein
VKQDNKMKSFLTNEEEASLVEAIREQEARTSAEIRVCVSYKLLWNHERYAWRKFEEVGMRDTRQRNAVLIVMMPRTRKIVIVGDSGVNVVVPPGYWKDAVAAMVRQMHDAGPLEALREGLRRLGDTLAVHWPREADDRNELPDQILK